MIFYWIFCIIVYLTIVWADISMKDKAKKFDLVRVENASFAKFLVTNVLAILWSIMPVWNLVVLVGVTVTVTKIEKLDLEGFLEEFKNWRVK